MAITLATLDMAGTTVDDHELVYEALKETVESLGYPVPEERLQKFMGTEKRSAIDALSRAEGAELDDNALDAAFASFQQLLRAKYEATPPSSYAGVPEALAQLRAAGIKVVLTTGFSREIALLILDGLNWALEGDDKSTSAALVLDGLVAADEARDGRPAPYLIHHAMELTGTRSVDEVLVAGDTIADLESGANAGAKFTVGVTSGKLTAEDLSVRRSDAILGSVAELPQFLGLSIS